MEEVLRNKEYDNPEDLTDIKLRKAYDDLTSQLPKAPAHIKRQKKFSRLYPAAGPKYKSEFDKDVDTERERRRVFNSKNPRGKWMSLKLKEIRRVLKRNLKMEA